MNNSTSVSMASLSPILLSFLHQSFQHRGNLTSYKCAIFSKRVEKIVTKAVEDEYTVDYVSGWL